MISCSIQSQRHFYQELLNTFFAWALLGETFPEELVDDIGMDNGDGGSGKYKYS